MHRSKHVARHLRSHTAPGADPDGSLPRSTSRLFRDHNATRKRKVLGRLLSPVALAVLVGMGAAADWPWASPAVADAVAAADAPCLQSDLASSSGGGGNNQVLLYNVAGGNLQVRGMAQLNQIPGPTVGPVNCALTQNGVLTAP